MCKCWRGRELQKDGLESERGPRPRKPWEEMWSWDLAFSLRQWRAIRAVAGCRGHLAPKETFVNVWRHF